jgi:flagellar hook assembly protein FlgD
VKIADAYAATPNFQPATDSPVQNASYWIITAVPVIETETGLVNYPNPFSEVTNIELQLEKVSEVRITILDISGKIVANLQNGKLMEGTHRFTFDATNLPKGIYVAKVITGNTQKAIKMLSY